MAPAKVVEASARSGRRRDRNCILTELAFFEFNFINLAQWQEMQRGLLEEHRDPYTFWSETLVTTISNRQFEVSQRCILLY